MPTRRTTLIGLSVLTAGGAGAVATGAFSAASAERKVSTSFASNDTEAILAFQPTSAYAELDGDNDHEILIDFEDLNRNANFTFEDTFIIVNNGTETVALEGVGSSGGDSSQWRNEDSTRPASVLISNSVNKWQGSPNEEFIDDSEVDASVADDGSETENVDADYFHAGDLSDNTVELGPRGSNGSVGDWISIGFEFGQSDSVGEWTTDDIPETLRFEFGQGDGQ